MNEPGELNRGNSNYLDNRACIRFGNHEILDESTVKKISDELIAVAERAKCRHLIVNFTSVRRLSTLMLGRLLMLRRITAAKGGRLILCEIGPDTEYVFVETRLILIFEIVDMEADALEGVSCPHTPCAERRHSACAGYH